MLTHFRERLQFCSSNFLGGIPNYYVYFISTAGSLFEPMKMSRVFTMYNSGPTLLTLYLVGIGDGGREEGGFSVMNYHREIIIKPNKTKSIEIS